MYCAELITLSNRQIGQVVKRIKEEQKPLYFAITVHDPLVKMIIPVGEYVGGKGAINDEAIKCFVSTFLQK